ncbi:GGDEF domain-containing protein [Deinococcus petrolearius]|uniref:GGDEF domain-containing protein n=1 Tax=Deinococcus petrolearius TaxID=1751295 RepID=A0ABW1DFA3_9DEIO
MALNGQRHLLWQLRERLRLGLCASVLLDFVWMSGGGGPEDGTAPLRAGMALVALLGVILSFLNLARRQPGPRLGEGIWTLPTLPIALLWAAHLGRQGDSPAELLVWLNVGVLALFVFLGSALGTAFNAALGLGLTLVLVAWPPAGEAVMLWRSATLALPATGILGFSLMRFTEVHLAVHDETSDLLRAARLDALTDTLGRAALEEHLAQAAAAARRGGTPLSVIVTDIDHFKGVNDRHGHGVGDDVLRAFAKRLRRNVGGQGGTVGRWGGEEFLVVLPGLPRTDALALAETLCREVARSPLAGLTVTASFGVAALRGEPDSPGALFARADARLYEAKAAGRNTVR